MSDADSPISQVLAQADALMRRHRVFVAGGATAGGAVEDDIPVLTEIVGPADAAPEVALDDALARNKELEMRLRGALLAWIDEALPQEIVKVTETIADQLLSAMDTRLNNELLPRLMESIIAPDTQPPPAE